MIVVVLAGGEGRRMGGNKPLYPWQGTTLIEATINRLKSQAEAIYINAGHPGPERNPIKWEPLFGNIARPNKELERRFGSTKTHQALESLGYPLVHDEPIFAGLGPLSGVHSALRLAVDLGRDAVVTAPCDMPFLPLDMVAQLMAHDTDIVHFGGERDYPLTTLWRSSLLPSLEAALIAARPEGGLKVMRYIASQRAVRIEAKDPAAFGNINRPEDI